MGQSVLQLPSLLPAMGDSGCARLAFDIATQLKSTRQILDEYELTPQELTHRLKTDTQLINQIGEIKAIWASPLSAKDRTQLKTAIMAEDGLRDLWAIFVNDEVHPNTRLDIHRHLVKLGNLEPRPENAAAGSRFTVTINLPNCDPLEIGADIQGEADLLGRDDDG